MCSEYSISLRQTVTDKHEDLQTDNWDMQRISKALYREVDVMNGSHIDFGHTMSSVYCGIEKICHTLTSLIPVDPPLALKPANNQS